MTAEGTCWRPLGYTPVVLLRSEEHKFDDCALCARKGYGGPTPDGPCGTHRKRALASPLYPARQAWDTLAHRQPPHRFAQECIFVVGEELAKRPHRTAKTGTCP